MFLLWLPWVTLHASLPPSLPPVLCEVIQFDGASRQVVTRALWCLANQSLRPALVSHLVPGIVEVVSRVILSHRFDNPVVDSEALSILSRYVLESSFQSCDV